MSFEVDVIFCVLNHCEITAGLYLFANKFDILILSHERKMKIAEENVKSRDKKIKREDEFGWDEAPVREMVKNSHLNQSILDFFIALLILAKFLYNILIISVKMF